MKKVKATSQSSHRMFRVGVPLGPVQQPHVLQRSCDHKKHMSDPPRRFGARGVSPRLREAVSARGARNTAHEYLISPCATPERVGAAQKEFRLLGIEAEVSGLMWLMVALLFHKLSDLMSA